MKNVRIKKSEKSFFYQNNKILAIFTYLIGNCHILKCEVSWINISLIMHKNKVLSSKIEVINKILI